ncbi:MAG TPA: dephospho-CoA kinase [Armatimonadetes bacterium]|jgi:dephospho-CoA kinase|nr:dephospho-CoA kinase [Armatimonadota bacterium]
MRVVGITGGIATGKSTVAAMFQECGAALIDADALSRAAVVPCQPAYHAVVAQFGTSVLRDDGTLDRRALGALVFRDAEARRRLEEIIHPHVVQAIQRQLVEWRASPSPPRLVVVEIPLLYEAGLEEMVDTVVVVSSEQATQLQRLITRTGLAPEEAMLRIAAQMPLSEKEARAAHVISTEKPLHAVREEVCKLYEELLAEEGIERDGPTS